MDMNYCMQCGTRLVMRHHEAEGEVPYCETCEEYRYPVFNTAVSMIVMNEAKDRIILIKQYGKPTYVLVAGYVDKGEDAETAVAREVMEELGMTVSSVRYNRSHYYERTNTLMLNFSCVLRDAVLHPNQEIDACQWFSYPDAVEHIKPESLARKFLMAWLKKYSQKG